MRAGITFRYGLVIDTPDCTHSQALAAACPSCHLILCAPQEGDGPVEDREPVYSRDAYHQHSSARVRKVAMQDVPSLEPHTLDFALVRQLRIDTSVDQQAGASSACFLWCLLCLLVPPLSVSCFLPAGQCLVFSWLRSSFLCLIALSCPLLSFSLHSSRARRPRCLHACVLPSPASGTTAPRRARATDGAPRAEIESVIGLLWGLVKEGGYLGVLHDVNQIIVVVDADGNLWEHYADYPKVPASAAASSARERQLDSHAPPIVSVDNARVRWSG